VHEFSNKNNVIMPVLGFSQRCACACFLLEYDTVHFTFGLLKRRPLRCTKMSVTSCSVTSRRTPQKRKPEEFSKFIMNTKLTQILLRLKK
jgi:hypothetical protein